ncbi:MAG: HAD family hydrolase [Cellvibrionaceae bacterium]
MSAEQESTGLAVKAVHNKVAVIDVDGTLYRANTLFSFSEYFWYRRSTIKWIFLKSGSTLPGKAFFELVSLFGIKNARRSLVIKMFQGVPLSDLQAAAALYVSAVLPKFEVGETFDLVRQFQREGYAIYLISGSIDPIINAVAARVGADWWSSAELESVLNVVVGDLRSDVRGSKLEVLKRQNPHVTEFCAVTDNPEDLELIIASNSAWVITKARKRRWWRRVLPRHAKLMELR